MGACDKGSPASGGRQPTGPPGGEVRSGTVLPHPPAGSRPLAVLPMFSIELCNDVESIGGLRTMMALPAID